MKARVQFSYKLDMTPDEFAAQAEVLGRAVEAAATVVGRRDDSGVSPSAFADFMELAHRVVDRLEPARSPFTMPDPPPPFGGEDDEGGEDDGGGEGEDEDGDSGWTTPKWET
jgi:hypothetical protein